MYELIQVSPRDYYIESPAKIGLVLVGEGEAVLLDSGSDKDAGKKALRVLEGNGWKLRAIYNTHSHADHIGGNRFLQDRTGCAVYASGIECDFTNHPVLESACLYGGFPLPELRHKFLLAQESRAGLLTAETLPAGFELIPLPGHSFDMVGFRTPDNTVYLADCVSSEETLSKYGIGYLWDVAASLETLDKVEGMQAAKFVPAHAPATEDIAPLARRNREAILEAAERIEGYCAEPVLFDDLLKKVFDGYGLVLSAQQFALIGSTVRSYLAYLRGQGRLEFEFVENRMLWKRV